MKASDLKVGDRYKIEFEVTNVRPGYVDYRPVDSNGGYGFFQYSHSDAGHLQWATDHVPAPMRIEAGQRYRGLLSSKDVEVLFVNKDYVLVDYLGDSTAPILVNRSSFMQNYIQLIRP